MQNNIISFLMVLVMALGCGFAAHQMNESSEMRVYTITEPYVYPILPGSEEWRKFETGYEMVDACQLPEEMPRQMTTEALAKTVIDYPMLLDILAVDDHRHGFEFACESFNGLQELIQRADAWYYLSHEYLKMKQGGDMLLGELMLPVLLEQPEFKGIAKIDYAVCYTNISLERKLFSRMIHLEIFLHDQFADGNDLISVSLEFLQD